MKKLFNFSKLVTTCFILLLAMVTIVGCDNESTEEPTVEQPTDTPTVEQPTDKPTADKTNLSTPNVSVDDELKNKIVNKSQELQNIIIVTRGCKSTFSAANGVFYETPVKKVNAVNVIACGDSFSAGFLYEYIKSKDINASLQT